MSKKSSLLALFVVSSAVLASNAAKADPIFLGYSINGGSVVTQATSTTGAISFSTSVGGFTISISATGSPSVAEPNFSSNTVTVSGSTAGTIRLFASETGLTAQVPSFQLGLSNNPLSDTSVLESFYTSSTNTAYALTNMLGQSLMSPGVTTNLTTSTGSPTGPYSITELYTINFGSTGGTVNATIIERAAAVPEPVTASLFGVGLLGLGLMRLKKRAA